MAGITQVAVEKAGKFAWESIRKFLSRNKELRKENEALRDQVDQKLAFERLREQMVYSKEDDGVYWHKNGSGPYCATCLNADHRDILLVPGASQGVYSCPFHNTTHWMRAYRERVHPIPLPRRRRSGAY